MEVTLEELNEIIKEQIITPEDVRTILRDNFGRKMGDKIFKKNIKKAKIDERRRLFKENKLNMK